MVHSRLWILLAVAFDPVESNPSNKLFLPLSSDLANFEPVGCKVADFKLVGCKVADFEPVGCKEADFKLVGCKEVDFEPVGCKVVDFEPVSCPLLDLELVLPDLNRWVKSTLVIFEQEVVEKKMDLVTCSFPEERNNLVMRKLIIIINKCMNLCRIK